MAHSITGKKLWTKIISDSSHYIQSSEVADLKKVFDKEFDTWKEVQDYQLKSFYNSLYSLSGWNSKRIFQLQKSIESYLR